MARHDAPAYGLWLRVQRELHDRGWTISDLRRKAGVSRQTIYNLEAGRTPMPATINRLADTLGIPRNEAYRLAGRDLPAPVTPTAGRTGDNGTDNAEGSVDFDAMIRDAIARLPERRRRALERILAEERARYERMMEQARADYERAVQRVAEMAQMDLEQG